MISQTKSLTTQKAAPLPAFRPGALLQRAAVNSAAPVPAVPSVVQDVLRSPGRPLDAGTRALLEPRFGHDFSGVRVHTDDRAALSARAVDAQAYTVGRDVVFGAGQYAPGTSQGRHLLAHELTHVAQQRHGPAVQARRDTGPSPRPDAPDAESPAEREAEGNADRLETGQALTGSRPAAGPIQFRLLSDQQKPHKKKPHHEGSHKNGEHKKGSHHEKSAPSEPAPPVAPEPVYVLTARGQERRLHEAEFRAALAEEVARIRRSLDSIDRMSAEWLEMQRAELGSDRVYRWVAEAVSRGKPPSEVIWTMPLSHVRESREALNRVNATVPAAHLQDAVAQFEEARKEMKAAFASMNESTQIWLRYTGAKVEGFQYVVTGLTVARDVSFTILITTAAVAAAPLVAAGAATVSTAAGLSGAAGVGATALGTGGTLAAGGAAIGGGLRASTNAVGQKLVNHRVDWHEALREGGAGAKQGALDAGTSLISLGSGRIMAKFIRPGAVTFGARALRNAASNLLSGSVTGLTSAVITTPEGHETRREKAARILTATVLGGAGSALGGIVTERIGGAAPGVARNLVAGGTGYAVGSGATSAVQEGIDASAQGRAYNVGTVAKEAGKAFFTGAAQTATSGLAHHGERVDAAFAKTAPDSKAVTAKAAAAARAATEARRAAAHAEKAAAVTLPPAPAEQAVASPAPASGETVVTPPPQTLPAVGPFVIPPSRQLTAGAARTIPPSRQLTAGAPRPVEPATAEPATAEPATAEPATAEPATAEPATAEPATAEPATAEPATAEPAIAKTAPTEAAPAEVVAAEPTAAKATAAEAPSGPWQRMAEGGAAGLAEARATIRSVGDWKGRLRALASRQSPQSRTMQEAALHEARTQMQQEARAEVEHLFPDMKYNEVGSQGFRSDTDVTFLPENISKLTTPEAVAAAVERSGAAARAYMKLLRAASGGEPDVTIDTNAYTWTGTDAPLAVPAGQQVAVSHQMDVASLGSLRQSLPPRRWAAFRQTARQRAAPRGGDVGEAQRGIQQDVVRNQKQQFSDVQVLLGEVRAAQEQATQRLQASEPALKGKALVARAREEAAADVRARLVSELRRPGGEVDYVRTHRLHAQIKLLEPGAYVSAAAIADVPGYQQALTKAKSGRAFVEMDPVKGAAELAQSATDSLAQLKGHADPLPAPEAEALTSELERLEAEAHDPAVKEAEALGLVKDVAKYCGRIQHADEAAGAGRGGRGRSAPEGDLPEMQGRGRGDADDLRAMVAEWADANRKTGTFVELARLFAEDRIAWGVDKIITLRQNSATQRANEGTLYQAPRPAKKTVRR